MAKQAQKSQNKAKTAQIIRITAKIEGFRRAGQAHFGTEEYPLCHFSKAQIASLKAEPNLVIQFFSRPEQQEQKPADEAANENSGSADDNETENGSEITPAAEPAGGDENKGA
ncbi:HI1506-related protein [Candidatus Tokpelaia sp.]|uniref:HI1506-related protein n=1 Tax=Candidatus Tokpelaia sp. TaxID=2233777 RepID=UPI0012388D4E|nr:HI1506-related protein [Candidatus Tokpelaia sp.]KAA6404507.1 hypothetical protein DPQ22_09765 [Candidatus Tokpelaia sp.]